MQRRVYLDHAATTPMLPEVAAAVAEQWQYCGNASSLHASGRRARRVVEESREAIAATLGAQPTEVVFTSGGTESDNLAVLGTFRARHDADPRAVRVAASAVEHHAVLDCVEFLVAREDAKAHWLWPDPDGVVRPDVLADALADEPETVALASVMWANNEVGTVQPVAELAAVAHRAGVPFHTDAVQAVGHVPVHFADSGADLLTLTAHKLGGPLGVGALLVRRDAALVPQTHGGGHERGLRSGTLDVPGIAGFATAVTLAVSRQKAQAARLVELRDRLLRGATEAGLSVRVGGRWTAGDGRSRLPGNAHLLVRDCEGDSLLYLLDAAGVECSTGSACQAGVPQPSHVLLAMGLSEAAARGALRLTLGHTSTEADIDAVLAALPAAVEQARRAHAAGAS